MMRLPWLFYILAGVLAFRSFMFKVTSHMKFHTLMRSFGNGYSSVCAEVHYCVTYTYVDSSGKENYCIENIRSDKERVFRIKGDMNSEDLLQIVETELIRRIMFNPNVLHSVQVHQVTRWSEFKTPISGAKYVSEMVKNEMKRIEDVFMGLPRTIG
jgi:hypothetical protein